MNKLIALTFSARWSVIVNIVLAAVLGYQTMQFFLLFDDTPLASSSSHNHSPKIIKQTPPLPLDISALPKTNLFGKSTSFAKQNAKQNAKTLPKTKLNLKLHGIYYSSNSLSSYAMIAEGKGQSILYRINESLPSGVVLHKIHPKQVILFRNGRYETLPFMEVKKPIALNYANKMPQSREVKAEKLLGKFQRQLRNNPQKLLKLIRIFPVSRRGNFLGYRIKPKKDATLLTQFNLQSGDILTAVNGVKLDSPLKGLGIIQQLATANQIDLQVLRNGRVVSLSFAVEK